MAWNPNPCHQEEKATEDDSNLPELTPGGSRPGEDSAKADANGHHKLKDGILNDFLGCSGIFHPV